MPRPCDVTECSDPAVKFCLTCSDYYCTTHVKDHYTSSDLQRHQLRDLQHQDRCEQHDKKLKYYCLTDQSAVCSRCLLHNHKGHDVIEQNMSTHTILAKKKGVPPPGPIEFLSVSPNTVALRWPPPEGASGPYKYSVIWRRGQEQQIMTVNGPEVEVRGLLPGEKYHFAVATLSEDGHQSSWTENSTFTDVPAPENLTVESHTSHVSLKWTKPDGADQVSYLLELLSKDKPPRSIHTDVPNHSISDLQHGIEYTIQVSTLKNGRHSKSTSKHFRTRIPVPEQLSVSSITSSSASLSWRVSSEMKQTPHSFLVSYHCEGTEPMNISTESCSTDITGLKPGAEYTVSVYTALQSGGKSQPASDQIKTGVSLSDVLSALHLDDYKGGKLTLSSVLEISSHTVSDEPAERLEHLPLNFLKRLIMSNVNSRNWKYEQKQKDKPTEIGKKQFKTSDAMNPLDLITALFHCADPFLQQEMVSKMSMCQFAVPLLLPNCDTQQCTLMLWAMRELVKKYRPQSLAGGSAFIEDRVVEMNIPMVSFVRLGKSSLPKSQILNKLLSSPHQHNDAFVDHDMEYGNVPRKISDGLVEVSWYLPRGKGHNDVFTEPLAIANLRGDGRSFKTQMSFLCQTSAAVFIFSDELEGDFNTVANTECKAELFLVTNSQSKTFKMDTFRDTCRRLKVKDRNVLIKENHNSAEFVQTLRSHVSNVIEKNPVKTTVENMADVAHQFGISVDEDCEECQNSRKNAEGITSNIISFKDIMAFKENQLPLHGKAWRKISELEKERCRLRKADREKSIEHYRSSLNMTVRTLREEQHRMDMSDTMKKFIAGISQLRTERLYFMKWLKIQLDTLCRCKLSELREKYKKCCKNTPVNKDEILKLDDCISKSSLGPEHFFRELGQIYESASSLPEDHPARQKVQHLPTRCAQLLLDGFPVELVDGDTSNIPMKWISEVLTQLHQLVNSKSRILVLTVLGVQGTGKSTLLNTMFGVQFAVSNGRCTRGAFMQLIKVSEELRSELKCDLIMVIDTEGLKSPELAAIDTSYEHDNELATLVIGLSDITIVNVAMENNTEMKDILQIVIHAFLRMTEVGKRPRCVFVHQNVSDMSAHDSNLRDKNKMVEQLDEMTQVAAKMEKKEANTKFTDVMVCDPDKDSYYIPGLWHGTPPMAPVNADYSEAVYELRKCLIGYLISDDIKSSDAIEFLKWTKSLWNSVKFENFIFNFRNSLVADAYANLGTEYNKWEWSFQKEINNWLTSKETMLSSDQLKGLRDVLKHTIHEASEMLHTEEKKILSNLDKYFENKDSNAYLVEKYRQEFLISAKSLKQETESSIKLSLERVVEIKEGMEKVNKIKEKQIDTIETKVHELLKQCNERKTVLSENELKGEFEKMWEGIMSELTASLPERDAYPDVLRLFISNVKAKAGFGSEMLSSFNLMSSGEEKFIVTSDYISDLTSSAKAVWCAIKHMDVYHFTDKVQEICDRIIEHCDGLVAKRVVAMKKNNTDYHDTYIKEVLEAIDDQVKNTHITDKCAAKLKFHICGKTAKRFQEIHKEFNIRNDPQAHLMKSKQIFLNKFLEFFSEQDQCQRKATEFTKTCVAPQVKDYVSKHLGQAIADEMKTGEGGEVYSSHSDFQFALLKQLLERDSFKEYRDYAKSNETFVKDWIKKQIKEKMSESGRMAKLQKNLLSKIIHKIINAITSSSKNGALHVFIEEFCFHIGNDLAFPQDVLRTFLSLNKAKTDPFAMFLSKYIKTLGESLSQGYDANVRIGIVRLLTDLPSSPHELLFSSLYACRHQCPFCGMPCEAAGKGHGTHFSSMHRSGAFTGSRCDNSRKLEIDICTTLVVDPDKTRVFIVRLFCGFWRKLGLFFKDRSFVDKTHKTCPYKEYRTIYPDWEIKGDPKSETSNYWKYVLKKFNKEFTEAYDAQPADIPEEWERLTADDALMGLKMSYNKM
ncbi:interferon-induced very large GTPase 1-like [Sardina pilchardus]|uniref:interferon-induced very large GTPase 1-like n=1 Tax=Sardina pilchardus TaxID=27697 RepID=UPI002E0F2A31